MYPATNRLQDANIDYDAAGNVTRFSVLDSSQRWLAWDALNRMTAAWTGSPYPDGHTEVYTYDASNQRVMKQRDQDQPALTFLDNLNRLQSKATTTPTESKKPHTRLHPPPTRGRTSPTSTTRLTGIIRRQRAGSSSPQSLQYCGSLTRNSPTISLQPVGAGP
ncbi:MAG: hypothetical protein IT161_13530 [Bryobacterales bacterium]|nr:hypothetical protein [Bryobacterales bacterium]